MSDEEDKVIMEKHGITTEQKVTYHYKEFKYQSLKEAVKYAELQAARVHKDS